MCLRVVAVSTMSVVGGGAMAMVDNVAMAAAKEAEDGCGRWPR